MVTKKPRRSGARVSNQSRPPESGRRSPSHVRHGGGPNRVAAAPTQGASSATDRRAFFCFHQLMTAGTLNDGSFVRAILHSQPSLSCGRPWSMVGWGAPPRAACGGLSPSRPCWPAATNLLLHPVAHRLALVGGAQLAPRVREPRGRTWGAFPTSRPGPTAIALNRTFHCL
jgi:hypothetical protein